MELHGITRECDRLWAEGATALIGISPFNSYFSAERIAALIEFCEHGRRDVVLFVPDEVTRYTLQARGYPEDEAIRKTRRQVRYLRNKIAQAMGPRDLRILGCEALANNAAYRLLHDEARQRFRGDASFRQRCLDATRWVLSAREDEPVAEQAALIGVRYLLAELPLFFHAPAILGKPVVFLYHQCPLLIEQTYRDRRPGELSPGQGFGVLRESGAEAIVSV